MSTCVTEDGPNVSDDSSSSQSSEASTTPSSLSMFEQNPDIPPTTIPSQYQIPKSIIESLYIPDNITLDNVVTAQKLELNPITSTSQQEAPKTLKVCIKRERGDKTSDETPLRRSNRKRDTKFDYRNRIDTLFNRGELQRLTLDELLAKAMSFDPDIRWNIDWCRYCGARASKWFDKSPWGHKQLCGKHNTMWNNNELDLSHFTEPKDVESVINTSDCSERQYLIDIICDESNNNSSLSCSSCSSDRCVKKEHKFKCDECDKWYLKKGNLDYHIGKIHSGCNKALFNKSEFVHIKMKKEKQSIFVCPHCEQEFKKNHYMKRHIINMHTPNKDKPYQCSYCMYGAATKWQIDTHEDIHRNERRYKCRFCGRGFNAKKNMERHTLNDHIKPYKCAHCDRGFGTVGYLQSHVINVHTKNKDKPYQCNVCDYGASSLRRVKKHQLIHSNVRPFKCGQCSKSFKTLNYLHSHLNRVHEIVGNNSNNNMRKSECNVCGKRFAQSYLKYHVLSHSNIKPYKCSKCDYATQFKKRLEKHEMTHNAEKPFECDICYKRFRIKWYVETHKKNVHRNGKLGNKRSLPPKPKDSQSPKKALSSYFIFAKEVRESVKKEFNEESITQIAKEISKKWNVLSAEQKRPYVEEALRLKGIYMETLEEYKTTAAYRNHEERVKKWRTECERIKRERCAINKTHSESSSSSSYYSQSSS